MDMEQIGDYAFLAGVIIAIAVGILSGLALVSMDAGTAGLITLVLVVLGLIVGFLNVKDKEVKTFLIAAIALISVGSAQLSIINEVMAPLGTVLQVLVQNIAVFVAPAALIVALKAVYVLAKESKPSTSAMVK